MDSKKLIKIGQACFGRSWQSQLADRLQIDRRNITNWIKFDKVPSHFHDEIYHIIEVRYFELKRCYKEEMENGMKKSELSLEFGTHGNVAKAFRENKSDEIVMYLCENNIESIAVWSNGRNFIHIHKDGLFSVKEFIDNHIGIITHASGLSWSDACNF